MIQYSDYIYFEGTNDPVNLAAVTVMIANTQTPATLYDPITSLPINNPVTTDQTGLFTFATTAGQYDLYFLGVKQYQIAINEATGFPDPLTLTGLTVTGRGDFSELAVGTTDPMPTALTKVLIAGKAFIKDPALVWPLPAYPTSGAVHTSGVNSNYTGYVSSAFSDTFNFAPTAVFMHNKADGTLPLAGFILARYAGGWVQSTGGSYSSASVSFVADKDCVQGVTHDTSILLNTSKDGSAGTERMRVTAGGNILIGRSTDTTTLPKLQIVTSGTLGGLYVSDGTNETALTAGVGSMPAAHVVGTTYLTSSVAAEIHIDTPATAPRMLFLRQMTNGSMVNAPDLCIGMVQFGSASDSSTPSGAVIRGYTDDIWTAGVNSPGRLEFQTTPQNSNIPTTKMTVRSDGIILIGTTALLNPTAKLQVNGDIYATGSISAGSISYSNIDATGNLTFTSTGQFIRGDMSNITGTNRLSIQSSTVDGVTVLDVIPNGTAVQSEIQFYTSPTKNNCSNIRLGISGTAVQLFSRALGTGTALPMIMGVGGEAIRIHSGNNVSIGGTANNGYKLEVTGNLNVTGSITAGALSYSNIDTTGNLTFTATGQFLRGDMSNTTAASRFAVQTSTLDGATQFDLIPNGTSTSSGVSCFSSTDRANSSRLRLVISSAAANVVSNATGTGVVLPLELSVGALTGLKVSTLGNVLLGATTDDTVSKLQVVGGTRMTASGFTPPHASYTVTPPLRVIGNSVNTAAVRLNFYSDTAANAHGVTMTKNLLNGDQPAANWSLGAIRWASLDATGAEKSCALIEGFSEEQLTDLARGSSLRFTTTPIGSATLTERMRITPAGSVLIGQTTDTGQALQVTGAVTISAGLFSVNTAVSPITPPPGAILLTSGGTNIVNSSFTDTATGTSHRICLYRNLANGALPVAGNSLGAMAWGSNNNGSMINSALIVAFAEENFVSGSAYGTSMRFNTAPLAGTAAAERMRITSEGIVLIGSTVPVGAAKLQVTGDMTITGAFTAGSISYTDISATGNLNFTGTGQLITGDFTDTTTGVMIQSTVTNGATLVRSMPNGSSRVAGFKAINAPDRANNGSLLFQTGTTEHIIQSGNIGTGTLLPLRLQMQGLTTSGITLTATSKVLIGTTTDDTRYDLQIAGTSISYPTNTFTVPLANIPTAGLRIINNSVSTRDLAVNTFYAGGTGLGSRLMLMRNSEVGGYPIAPAILGAVCFGTQNPTTGADVITGSIICKAAENFSDTARSTSMTITTTANTGKVSKIQLLPTGIVVVGDAVSSTGTATLQVVGNMRATGVPVYANNAAAIAGGLTAGDFYRTGADPDPLCIVH